MLNVYDAAMGNVYVALLVRLDPAMAILCVDQSLSERRRRLAFDLSVAGVDVVESNR